MLRATLIGTACALLGACATEGPQPTAQMATARTLVTQADKSQAQRYAAADLQRAHDELSQAETADTQHKYNEARSLAESAAADADVAVARAQAGEAQRAAGEVERSNATLQHESERAAEANSMPPPPPSQSAPQ
jgi:hypothetical protein